jgi:ethanolamine utilization protein EutN
VATIHQETFDGYKLLLVERLNLEGKPTSYYDIAVDVVQAGVGDVVLVLDEGNSARQIIGKEPDGAIRAVIAGVVDEISIQG